MGAVVSGGTSAIVDVCGIYSKCRCDYDDEGE